MAGATTFRDNRVWQYAMQLAVDVYQLASTLPPSEKPGLATDLQRTVVEVPTLIASGHKTGSRSGMATAGRQALETCAKLETLLTILGQLYPNVPSNDLIDQLDEVQQMLTVLIKRLSQSNSSSKKAL
jgi:four helix bundle protein